jgi:cbb3-type cytochrome oxidase subunit 3
MIEIFLIFLILCFLISLFIYFKFKKKDEFSEEKILKDENTVTGQSNRMKDHLALALLEREKILNTNGLLPGSNNSICYGLDGKKIKGCKCHPTCKTCGYGKDPKGMNQCLTCINGSDVNSLYRNGAGWCSIENSKKPSMIKTKTGQNFECNNTIIKLCGLKNKYDNNGDYSGWDKCLKDNEKKLLISGCQFDKDYKIKAAEPYKCEECISIFNPYNQNKDIGAQKCCSGDKNCYMRRCSVSAEKEKGGVVTNIGSETSTSTTGYYHKKKFAPNFSITEDDQTRMERKITVTFKITDKIIPEKSQITISNLAGVSTTKNTRLPIDVDVKTVTNPSNPSTSIFGSTTLNTKSDNTGSWNKVNGYLILTVSDGVSIPANTDVTFSFNLKLNSSMGRDSSGITPQASLISGDDTYRVMPQDAKEQIFKWGANSAGANSAGANGAGANGAGTPGHNQNSSSSVVNEDGTTTASGVVNEDGTTTVTGFGYCGELPTTDGHEVSIGCTSEKPLKVKDTKELCATQKSQCYGNSCEWTGDQCINKNFNKYFCSKTQKSCGTSEWTANQDYTNSNIDYINSITSE